MGKLKTQRCLALPQLLTCPHFKTPDLHHLHHHHLTPVLSHHQVTEQQCSDITTTIQSSTQHIQNFQADSTNDQKIRIHFIPSSKININGYLLKSIIFDVFYHSILWSK